MSFLLRSEVRLCPVRVPKRGALGRGSLEVRRDERASKSPTLQMRGFTLIEVMVVVLIVTLLSAMAVPTISRRLDSNEARGLTENAAMMFRSARLNAFGRGAATAIRYEGGRMVMMEAVQGTTCGGIPGCATLPVNSCTTRVDRFIVGGGPDLHNRELSALDVTRSGTLVVTMGYELPPLGTLTISNAVDICFTPGGRTFVRAGASSSALDAVPFTPLTGSAQILVRETTGMKATRFAVIAPNGAARAVHP